MPAIDSPWTSPTPHSKDRIHAAAVYCSDGRFGEQFDDLCQSSLQLPRYDRLAIPGGPGCLAGHFAAHQEETAAKAQLQFLIEAHGLERVVLIAHQGCAFYTHRLRIHEIDLQSRQLDDLKKAASFLRAFNANLQIDAFFAAVENNQVTFEHIHV